MKKFTKLALLMIAIPFCLVAQEQQETVLLPNKYQVMTNKFSDNWSVGGNIGAQMMFGDQDGLGDFGERFAPVLDIYAAKWFTPGLGLRTTFSLGCVKDFKAAGTNFGYADKSVGYFTVHEDIMFNISNMLYGYNPDRKLSIIPYLGFGIEHTTTDDMAGSNHTNFVTYLGVIHTFCLSDKWDLNIEPSVMMLKDNFDLDQTGTNGFKSIDFVPALKVGVAYKFGLSRFAKAATVPSGISEAEMTAVQERLNEQLAKNNQLENDLIAEQNKPKTVKEVVSNENLAARTIFFAFGKSSISVREKLNIKFTAEQIQNTPNKKFTVTGYADKGTGSEAYNQKLSERRANAVAQLLVAYGVNEDQLVVSGQGGVDEMFKPYLLNRVVVIK